MRWSGIGAALLVASIAGAGSVLAQDPIKARQGEMEQLGKRMAAIKDTVIDKKGGTLANVAANAEHIAGKIPQIPSWFPKGTEQGASETWALPKIWQDLAGFEVAAKNAQGLAVQLVAAARGGDPAATVQAFAKLGKEGCGGCHQPFRRPQD